MPPIAQVVVLSTGYEQGTLGRAPLRLAKRDTLPARPIQCRLARRMQCRPGLIVLTLRRDAGIAALLVHRRNFHDDARVIFHAEPHVEPHAEPHCVLGPLNCGGP
jgi:hypothetical protein